ncbi:homeotic protein female sterile-like [Culex pipiens pallens]|uniref:homeotic protein female sterile-like n=1 Tax=Culex pipiens pallens TaxID=42434 RepID=UPI00195338FD|nr:homeotic protein female sterile-like [Culex pipiens pallens]
MKLAIVLCVLGTALALPDGYHYDPPAVTSTLYFPSIPEDDCEQPAQLPEVTYQKELPTYTQHTSHVYTAPVKQQVQVLQPLKTHVTYEKEQVQNVWGSSGQQAQSTVWGSLGSLQKIEPAPQKVQQLNLWDTSKQQQQQQQQSSSWGVSSSSNANAWSSASQQQEQSSIWVKPQHHIEEVFKHVYVHVPPEDKEEYQPPQIIQPVAHKQKHYKIIFIKAPSPPSPKSVVVPPQPQNEEKTIVYVLHQKPEHRQEVIVQKPEPAKQNKPEVFFIKYKNQKQQVKKEVKYVSSTAAPASWEAKSSSGSSSYSSGASSGSSYSFVSSTAAPVVYSTAAPVVKIVESAPVSYSSSSSSSSSSNTGYSGGDSGSYSFVSSTASPIAYTTGHSVKVVETAPISTGYDYSSNQGSSGSSYSSFSSGSGAQSSGYESYVDLGNSGYSGFTSGGSGLGVINVGANDYSASISSSTVAPIAKSSSYVSTTPHSIVSSTIGFGGELSVRNSGSSGYSQRSSGRSRGTTIGTTKKPCRRCGSSTSAPLVVHENTYTSNVY